MSEALAPTPASAAWSGRAGMRFVLLFGVVSLFADMAYEGARSVTGPFLATLGATGLVVGTVAGLGELMGYALRLVSGRAADRSRLYWAITLAGYVVQMAAVPALALAGSWQAAAALVILERIGKATRNPPRDVMLARAGEQIGRGWAFGVHEALDQLGALIGPLLVAAILAWRHDYHLAFAWLAVPALATLALLGGARLAFPQAGAVAPRPGGGADARHPPAFWWYLGGACLVGFGFADFSLVAFHFAKAGTVGAAWIPIFYALAMGAGGLGSLALGRLYDRFGLVVLVPLTIAVALSAPLVFEGGFVLALVGVLLWGLGLGVHESAMSAGVADLVPSDRLAAAYGLFTAAFGTAWFAGSVVLGALYDLSAASVAWVAMIVQLLAAVPILIAARSTR